ncbi:restriction endonuclease [Paenibacillus sp. P26]|nr:restriction endonuclease [Paenibacillus sp. P26]UUZ89832.1 restriction endonuclease [Paenibacillus sp. P25]
MGKKKNTGIPYETLAQKVFSEILNQESVRNIQVQHNVVLEGRTTSHQIDVYWEFEVGGIKYTTIVQAKDWTSDVPQGEMLKFKAIIDDLPNQPRGIFITKKGYQSGAIDVAKANGIILYQLREPNEEDWEGKIKTVRITMHILSSRNTEFNVIPDLEWVANEKKNKGLGEQSFKIRFNGKSNEMILYDTDNKPVCSLQEVIQSMFPRPISVMSPQKIIKTFEEPRFIKTDLDLLPILKLSGVESVFSVVESVEEIVFDADTIVGFILRNVLDGEEKLFDKQGNLRKPLT